MKKKKNTILKAADLFVIFLCFAGAAGAIFLFMQDTGRTLTRQTAEPVGVIIFKRRSAQRKFIDRVIWDKLRQESPVYDGDTVRTAPKSEATVYFNDNSVMDLYENTLAQIFMKETGAAVSFTEGNISVSTDDSGPGFTVMSGGSEIRLDSGSSLSAGRDSARPGEQQDDSVLKISVQKGSAQTSLSGRTQTVSAGDTVSFSENGRVSIASISVSEPPAFSRIINDTGSTMPVHFAWHMPAEEGNIYVRIETSRNSGFSDIIDRIDTTGVSSMTLDVPSGNIYWRVYPVSVSSDGAVYGQPQDGVSGKLSVLNAPRPAQIAPVQNCEFSYRTQKPSVRFLWEGNDWATSYQLDISASPDMSDPVLSQRTVMTSTIMSNLGEGTWYWRVTPYYATGTVGPAAPSDTLSFTIRRSEMLNILSPLLPAQDSFVNMNVPGGNVLFSWENEQEAFSYTLSVADNPRMENPAVSVTISDNFYRAENSSSALSEGTWYWTVFQTDTEGNDSAPSPVRSFYAVTEDTELRAVFPPDNYTVSVQLVPYMRFTWKTNIPEYIRLQIADNPEFSGAVSEIPGAEGSAKIRNLAEGIWFWRIAAGRGTDVMSTPVRELTVAGSLDRPDGLVPIQGDRVVLKENGQITLKWQPVKEADYYRISLSRPDTGKTVYENLTEELSVQLPVDSLEQGAYSWTVQPFSYETPESSRRTGLLTESFFRLKKLYPVRLLRPSGDVRIDGLEALRNSDLFEWSSRDTAESSRFGLSKDPLPASGGAGIEAEEENPQQRISVSRLGEGTYYWTIEATDGEGFDISALEPASFTVLPIPRLPPAVSVSPAPDAVIGPEYLRSFRFIEFTWNGVPGATDYIFRLYPVKDPENILLDVKTEKTSVTLDNLSLLDRGTFVWEIEAVALAKDGFTEQHGIVKQTDFTIDLPATGPPETEPPGELYGK